MDHTYKCSLCGTSDDLGNYQPTYPLLNLMYDKKLCFHCAFWLNESEHPTPGRETIGGTCYLIQPFDEPPDNPSGSIAGASCYVYRYDRTFYRSYTIGIIGKPPEHLIHLFPDTARFMTPMYFRRLRSNNFTCEARGCWDRYRCLRYDPSCEKETGPMNQIPENYQIGSEACSSFLDKNNLFV